MSLVKNKSQMYTLSFKYKILTEIDKGVKSVADIAKEFGLPKSTVFTWFKYGDKIKALYVEKYGKKRKRAAPVCGPMYPRLEDSLLRWLEMMKESGNGVSSWSAIRCKAKELAEKLDLTDFKASNNWLKRFRERNGIVAEPARPSSGGGDDGVEAKEESDEEKKIDLGSWEGSFIPSILNQYGPDLIYSVDEFGLRYKLLPHDCVAVKDEKCCDGEQRDERVTVLLCANMTGSDKTPLYIVSNCSDTNVIESPNQLSVQHRTNENSWMTSDLFEEWLKEFDRRCISQNKKVALVLDNAVLHTVLYKPLAVELFFLPSGSGTGVLPLRQGIIRDVIHRYRQQIVQEITFANSTSNFQVGLNESMHMLEKAWNSVSTAKIRQSFTQAKFISSSEKNGKSNGEHDNDLITSDDDDDDYMSVKGLLKNAIGSTFDVVFHNYLTIDDDLVTEAPRVENEVGNNSSANNSSDDVLGTITVKKEPELKPEDCVYIDYDTDDSNYNKDSYQGAVDMLRGSRNVEIGINDVIDQNGYLMAHETVDHTYCSTTHTNNSLTSSRNGNVSKPNDARSSISRNNSSTILHHNGHSKSRDENSQNDDTQDSSDDLQIGPFEDDILGPTPSAFSTLRHCARIREFLYMEEDSDDALSALRKVEKYLASKRC